MRPYNSNKLADTTDASRLSFDLLTRIDSLVPVHLISRAGRPSTHRFYDTSPISPSGRYLAYLELPFDNRSPAPDDEATVILADLESGVRRELGNTTAWDTQVGAHVQWGSTDSELYFNVRNIEGNTHALRTNIFTGLTQQLDGPIYMVSSDGRFGLAPNINKLGLVQRGYGVRVWDQNHYRHIGAPDDDGLFSVDTATGANQLILSLETVYRKIQDYLSDARSGGLYGFHAKWHSKSNWALFMVRWLEQEKTGGRTKNFLMAYQPVTEELKLVVDPVTWGNGHHPNWWPDALDVVMNLPLHQRTRLESFAHRAVGRLARTMGLSRYIPNGLRLTRINALTGERKHVAPRLVGSGHPSIDPSGRFLVTDAYPDEPVAYRDGRVPIRLVDLRTGHEQHIMQLQCIPKYTGYQNEWRIDPHPAWSRCGRYLTMNANIEGTRSIIVADLTGIVEGEA